MGQAPPCYAGRAAICFSTGPLPTDDLSHLCALPLTTAPHPIPLVAPTRVVLPFAPGCTSCLQPSPPIGIATGHGKGQFQGHARAPRVRTIPLDMYPTGPCPPYAIANLWQGAPGRATAVRAAPLLCLVHRLSPPPSATD